LSAGIARAEEPIRIQVTLVWGTNDPKSPDPKHKAIGAALARKLSKSPFRWKNYFEVHREIVVIPPGIAKVGIKMSDDCVLDIKNLGDSRIETKLYGKGKLLEIRKDPLPKDWPLILAGNAENDTAWLVVIEKVPGEQYFSPR
jgi:hypothetical protein